MGSTWEAANQELDRIESNYKLRHPESASAEVQRIAAEEMSRAGINVDGIREKSRLQAERERKAIFAAGAKFMASRPETDAINGYFPCQANEDIILEYMQRHGLDFTSPYSYEEAFLAIRDRLISPKHKRTAQQVRKVNGIEISHEALDRLTARDMERLLQNPDFMEAVNALSPTK